MTGTEPIFLAAGAIAAWLYKIVTDKRVRSLEDELDAATAAHRDATRDLGDAHAAEVKGLRGDIVQLERDIFELNREHARQCQACQLSKEGSNDDQA